MKKKVIALVLVLLFTFTWLFSLNIQNAYSQTLENGSESLDIFMGSASIYVKASLIGSSYLFNQFDKNIVSIHPQSLKKVSISFIRLFDWKNTHSYFLDNVWYNNTNIKYISSTCVDLKLYFSENSSSHNISSYINSLSKYYYLYFSKVNESGNMVEYLSPYQHSVSFSKVVNLFGNDVPAVFKWISLNNLDLYDFYNVTIIVDYSSSKASFQTSYINFQKNGVSSLLKLFNWHPVKNDTRNIYLNIYSKFSEITSYPSIYNLTVLDPNTLFVHLNGVLKGNSTKNPFDIDLRYDLPHLYVERTFNNTEPRDGDYIEVSVKITDTGAFNVKNVYVSEPHWWDGSRILFKSGNIEENYSVIPSSSTKIMKYVVKINTSASLDIDIPPTNVSVEVYNNSFLLYRSNENILYLNSNAPFLKVFIEGGAKTVKPGEKYNYALAITNEGKSPAYYLQLGELKSLNPGETKTFNLTLSVDNATDLIKQVSSRVVYSFSNKTFEISSQSYPILFKPDEIMAPSAYLYVSYIPVNNTYVDAVFKISNIGVEDIPKIKLEGMLLPGLKYVSGNFTYVPKDNLFYNYITGLVRKHTVTYHAEFKVISDNIFLYPLARIVSSDGKITLVRYGTVDIFYNRSITLLKDIPKPPLLINEKYNYTIKLTNNGDADIYNITTILKGQPNNIKITSSPHLAEHVIPGNSIEFPYSFHVLRSGNAVFPVVTVNFVLGGKERKIDISSKTLLSVYGLKIDFSLDKNSIVENKYAHLKIIFQTDSPDYVHNINISIAFPNGLSLENGKTFFAKSIKTISSTYVIDLNIHGDKPGKYNISNILVSYYFKTKKINLNNQYPQSLSITINVSENMLRRYFIYFAIGLVISVGVGIYLRKIISS